jgi:hypothetical protein
MPDVDDVDLCLIITILPVSLQKFTRLNLLERELDILLQREKYCHQYHERKK